MSFEESWCIYDELRNELDIHSVDELFICFVTLMVMLLGMLIGLMLFIQGTIIDGLDHEIVGIVKETCNDGR